MPFPKRFIFTFLTIILCFVITFCSGEVILRISHLVHKRTRPIWIPDYYLGYKLNPHNRFTFELNEPDGKISVKHRTNQWGLLGEEISLKKKVDQIRIVILGDSYTEALQVSQEKTFCKLLEKKLNDQYASSKKTFQVINAGISGYSPIAAYLYYKRNISAFNPDIVILQIYANDVHNDYEATAMAVLDEKSGLPLKLHRYFFKKYYQRLGHEKDYQDYPWNIKVNNFFINHSRFYEYIYISIIKSNKKSALNKKMKELPEYHHYNDFFIVQKDNPQFKDDAYRLKAWNLTKKYILALRDLVKDDGAQFFVFNIPFHEQISSEKGDEAPTFYFTQPTNLYLNGLLKNLAKEENISYHDLYEELIAEFREVYYLKKDSHFNEKGHELTAEVLFKNFFNNFGGN